MVRTGHDDLDLVVKLAQAFRRKHNRHGEKGLQDEHKLVFERAQHNGDQWPADPWMRWKFTALLDEDFHFDVTHARGDRFRLRSLAGEQYKVLRGGHMKVNAHGGAPARSGTPGRTR